MRPDDVFHSWKDQRGQVTPPPDFAEKVMNAVRGYEARRQERGLRQLLFALAASRAGRIGFMTLGVLVFALRLTAVISVFVVDIPNPLE